jgi:2-hydroxychromene-2-carboxylate isomerase
MSTTPQSPVIEFWFDLASTYSYFSVMRIEEAAARAGVTVQWKPFLLGPIFQSFGWTNSPFVLQKEKGEYMWKDMAQQSRKYGLPWQQPSVFPRNSVLPVRVAMLGAQEPWIAEFSKGIVLASFAHDQDISRPEVVAQVLTQIGLDASSVMDEAQGEANKLALRQQTEEAARRKVFGAPTFFVGQDMYWGNDRLDDALLDASEMHTR